MGRGGFFVSSLGWLDCSFIVRRKDRSFYLSGQMVPFMFNHLELIHSLSSSCDDWNCLCLIWPPTSKSSLY